MIIKLLKFEEGFRPRPYYCSEEYPTIGYGFKLGKKRAQLPDFKLPEPVAALWLAALVAELKSELSAELLNLNDERQAVLISMAYQMGVDGLRKFKNFLAAVRVGDWKTAAAEMENSIWFKQTKQRAIRHRDVMLSGSFFGIYK